MDNNNFKVLDELSQTIKSKRPLTQAELKKLRDNFMIENTYHSNAIEGNTLTLRETAMILQEGITIAEKPIKDHLDLIGYKDAFEYIMELADRNNPLTEKNIKDIHSLVLMNDASNRGVYRRIPVTIVGALHTPPQPYLVPIQMEQLINDYHQLKQTHHIVEAISIFHLRFEGIHPFIDGNGRTGRLILNLELVKSGLLPINIKFSDRREYYNCFDNYYGDNHSSDNLTNLIIKYETEELQKRINLLNSF